MGSNKKIKIESVSKIETADYIDFHSVDIDIDGLKTSILIARKSTDIGVNVLFGHDILSFFDSEENAFKKIGEMIRESEPLD